MSLMAHAGAGAGNGAGNVVFFGKKGTRGISTKHVYLHSFFMRELQKGKKKLFTIHGRKYYSTEAFYQRAKLKKRNFDMEQYNKRYSQVIQFRRLRHLIQECQYAAIVFDLGGNGSGMGINMNRQLKEKNPGLLQQYREVFNTVRQLKPYFRREAWDKKKKKIMKKAGSCQI